MTVGRTIMEKPHMAKEHPRLKLGKGSSFVKTHLKQLPQESETWEADFRALPKSLEQTEPHYLGLAVALPKGDPLVYLPVKYTPTVNDLADLLADAMRRPSTGSPRRPQRFHFRPNPRWEELVSHLKELGIEVTSRDELAELEEVCLDFLRQMRKRNPGPVIMISHRSTGADRQFPVIDKWVRENGWIEIGRRSEGDSVARALADNGVVYENTGSQTLAEAMIALEDGLAEWFKDQEAAVRSSPPKVKPRQRRPHHDA